MEARINIINKLLAWLLCFGLAYLISCTGSKRLHYPIVTKKTKDLITVEITRKYDIIEFTLQDSTLNVGDTLKFTKGITPFEIRIIDTRGDYQSYIIRP